MIEAVWWIAQQAPEPFIVKLSSPPKDTTGIKAFSDVLLASLGLTGFLAVFCLVVGGILGGVMFWMRSKKPFDH